MKTFLFFSFILLAFLWGCSSDDELITKTADIEIMISASDNDRLSVIETIVYGSHLELRTHSYSDNHLPYKKFYLNQELPETSAINITYSDNSLVPIGDDFVPYTIEFVIKIDGEIALTEEYTVDESGYTVSGDLFLTEYFANK